MDADHLSYQLHDISPDSEDSKGVKALDSSGWQEALGAIKDVQGCRKKHSRDGQDALSC
jgi:hypothetical protein